MTQSLQIRKGGYTCLRHNECRDTLATFVGEISHNVEIEPKLQSLERERAHNKTTSTEYGAPLDIKASGIWGGRLIKHFHVNIFGHHAKFYQKSTSDAYKHHKMLKHKYKQKILVMEHSSFIPLIFACTGGASPCSTESYSN